MRFEFSARTERNAQELDIFLSMFSGKTFSYIGDY